MYSNITFTIQQPHESNKDLLHNILYINNKQYEYNNYVLHKQCILLYDHRVTSIIFQDIKIDSLDDIVHLYKYSNENWVGSFNKYT